MKKLLLSSVLLISVSIFSGCAVKTTSGITCVGCEGLPDCVPGPYGSCPAK